MKFPFTRRDFLKALGLAGAGLTAISATGADQNEIAPAPGGTRPIGSKYMGGFAAPKLETVRWGAIGVGKRGSDHLKQLSQIDGSEFVAISDLYEDLAKRGAATVEKLGKKSPTLYYGSPAKYHELLARQDIDAVFIAVRAMAFWNQSRFRAIPRSFLPANPEMRVCKEQSSD
jgi:hypothetical protein